jgi:hypothetical protein
VCLVFEISQLQFNQIETTVSSYLRKKRYVIAHATGSAACAVPEAARQVVIHQTGGLHERVTDGAAHEFEAALFQVLAHGVGDLSARRYL